MATARQLRCAKCNHQSVVPGLFKALESIAKGERSTCPRCGETCCLNLRFDFDLGGDGAECTVLDCFMSSESWTDPSTGQQVVFHPFLVVTKFGTGKRGTWLPYWHLVGNNPPRFGQWAPYMDESLFSNLLSQARAHGYVFGAVAQSAVEQRDEADEARDG